jgi:hypothetical protein
MTRAVKALKAKARMVSKSLMVNPSPLAIFQSTANPSAVLQSRKSVHNLAGAGCSSKTHRPVSVTDSSSFEEAVGPKSRHWQLLTALSEHTDYNGEHVSSDDEGDSLDGVEISSDDLCYDEVQGEAEEESPEAEEDSQTETEDDGEGQDEGVLRTPDYCNMLDMPWYRSIACLSTFCMRKISASQ